MNIADTMKPVATVGELREQLAQFDDKTPLLIICSANGLPDMARNKPMKELHLVIGPMTKPAGKVALMVGSDNLDNVEEVSSRPATANEIDEFYLKQKLLYHAGRLDENGIKSMKPHETFGGFSWELTKEEWERVCDKCALDDSANPENRHFEN